MIFGNNKFCSNLKGLSPGLAFVSPLEVPALEWSGNVDAHDINATHLRSFNKFCFSGFF